MSAVNPYTPPSAAVADVDSDGETGVQPVAFFSHRGRVGRLRYLAYISFAYVLVIVASFVGGALSAMAGLPEFAGWIGGLALIPYVVYWVMVSIQRSHDMGWNGWTSLLIIIPFVGLIWLFKGGTKGRNAYGLPPPPNTTAVRIGAFLLPAIMIIGIIAAVALPAYQQYTMRAKASQMR